MRYFIFLSYRGTNFHGWQRQPASMSVQQLLEETLAIKLGEAVTVTGAGRTDAGVHAMRYCAHFDTLRDDLAGNNDFIRSLNGLLPSDVAVEEIRRVQPDASARYSAISRTYIYRIVRRKNPFHTETGWFMPVSADVDQMNMACKILMEYTDFASFQKSNSSAKTTTCRIMEAGWSQTDDFLEFRITADRFLRNMVRAITGTMIDVGRGKISPGQFRDIVEARDRTRSGQSAPAKGLFLAAINYPSEIFTD
ncbi:MAG: tRNA pseudouridine(38-40) synthase TruA [Bacteroidales bacterium]|jgi:tRNA pseudouridine38-40 synthase|nr:tRNA pseudouridine(38-40) synthase TruA [Bacteroidales bacterium]